MRIFWLAFLANSSLMPFFVERSPAAPAVWLAAVAWTAYWLWDFVKEQLA